MTSKEMYEMRQQDVTYQEIADKVGLSKQAVYSRVHYYGKKLAGGRGRCFNINTIVYKGIYEHFLNHPEETVSSFVRKIGTDLESNPGTNGKMRMFLKGEHQSAFKINHIKKMCEVCGKTFEEMFELRKI